MTMVTAIIGVTLLTASACRGSDDSEAVSPATASTGSPSSTATETADPPAGAADLRGDWEDPKADWVVHFNDDGTYAEDYQGLENFRVGKYAVDGTTVSLIGDDGNTDKGTIKGETLVFNLGTLTRL
ncbi:hypothetical protein [Aeromicrobium sp.]|uniref:hypothetical protein n=1 Tax=Aeromicrobium sp. TaxID=1871063 RepID=UPI003C41F6FA